jgi:very-short-patch-repair endonuclease
MPAKNITAHQKISAEKLQRAKQLRRELTPAEELLWQELRGNKLGVHFRRQQIIAGFIVHFYCHSAALVIEVDGGVHQSSEQAQADRLRDKVLRELGLRVIRFKHDQTVEKLPRVVEKIRAHRGMNDVVPYPCRSAISLSL